MNNVRRLSDSRESGPPVRTIMRPGVVCPHDLELHEVARLMTRHGVPSVAVQGPSGRIVGLLAEWDVLRSFGSAERRTAADALHTPPHFVEPDVPALQALRMMARAGVPHLIVADGVAGRDQPLGMVSTRDLLLEMAVGEDVAASAQG